MGDAKVVPKMDVVRPESAVVLWDVSSGCEREALSVVNIGPRY